MMICSSCTKSFSMRRIQTVFTKKFCSYVKMHGVFVFCAVWGFSLNKPAHVSHSNQVPLHVSGYRRYLMHFIELKRLFPHRCRLYFWSEIIFVRSPFSLKHFAFTSSNEDDLFSKKVFFIVSDTCLTVVAML